MKSSQDNVSSDETTSSTTTKTQQKLKQNKKPSISRKQDLQAETQTTTRAITEHKKTPSDFSEEVVDDDNELSSEGAQSQVV